MLSLYSLFYYKLLNCILKYMYLINHILGLPILLTKILVLEILKMPQSTVEFWCIYLYTHSSEYRVGKVLLYLFYHNVNEREYWHLLCFPSAALFYLSQNPWENANWLPFLTSFRYLHIYINMLVNKCINSFCV